MPTFAEIYSRHARDYHALIEREDYGGNLLPGLRRIAPLAGARVVEFGAGTGRLTRLLLPIVAHVDAYDASPHMLEVAREQLSATGSSNWRLGVADNRHLPVASGAADVAIAGWTFGHATDWDPEGWAEQIGAGVDEMQRVLRPGGTAVIIETMTTGIETPAPPTAALAAYYRWLETKRGFSSTVIRTDYRFESLDEAERLTRFFFGPELADRVRREGSVVLPENSGLFWREFGRH